MSAAADLEAARAALEDAERALAASRANVEHVEAQVLAGDPKMKASHLEQAVAQVRFDELRVDGAIEAVAQRDEEFRLAQIDEVLDGGAAGYARRYRDILAALHDAAEALQPLVAAVGEFNSARSRMIDQLAHLGDLPYGVTLMGGGGLRFDLHDAQINELDVEKLLAEALDLARTDGMTTAGEFAEDGEEHMWAGVGRTHRHQLLWLAKGLEGTRGEDPEAETRR